MEKQFKIPRWIKEQHPWVDKTESPEGFIAVAKGSPDGKNICNHCDYRSICITKSENICHSTKREDNMSVMFKKKEN